MVNHGTLNKLKIGLYRTGQLSKIWVDETKPTYRDIVFGVHTSYFGMFATGRFYGVKIGK